MLNVIPSVHWKHLFADDLSILIAPSSTLSPANMMSRLAEQTTEALKQLLEYSVNWKQEINLRKTCWILFHRQVAPRIPDISVDGYVVNHVSHFKYLGTILDAKLSFTPHMNYVRAKIKTSLNIFKRLAASRMLSETVRYRLFNAYIRPHFQTLLNIFHVLNPTRRSKSKR